MKIIKDGISVDEVKEMSKKMFGNLVKAVVDVKQGFLAIDAPLHADLMELLITEEGSEPQYLWGINVYPEMEGDNFIEFDSMINLKPGLGNRTRGVEDSQLREKIMGIVGKTIKK